MSQKRVLAIHDISCFGRCSLTTALPIISSVGAECTVLPTAVLSTHTGGFTGFTYRDLTSDIVPIVDHWKSLGLRFDAIYTGFLGSFEQIAIVADTFDRLSDGTLIVVDPVMADNGKLYPIFGEDFPAEMRKVASKADVLMPNITEAALLLGEEYKEGPYTSEYIDGLMERLTGLGPKRIVLTGVCFDDSKLGAATYDADTGERSYYLCDRIPGYYHGTGDVFGSAIVAALISGRSLSDASRIAVDYTVGSIRRTYDAGTDVRFGVNFEEGIPQLINDIITSYESETIADRVSELAHKIWPECYEGVISDEQIEYMLSTYHSRESILEEIESGYEFVVLRDNGRDVGYCGFHQEKDRLYIGKLYLMKECRGKGIGKRAMDIIDSYTRRCGLKKQYLRVNKKNPTVGFYRHMGFAVAESVVTDVGCGFVMDDYIMERTLE